MRLPDASDGQVLSQAPPPNASGVSAPKISLLVAEPALPQSLVMPSFVGQPLGSVASILQDAGLRMGTVSPVASDNPSPPVAITAPSPASIVASQNPAAGERIVVGATVNFAVR
jgi:beta-lactam-binding protein with PASTA domain